MWSECRVFLGLLQTRGLPNHPEPDHYIGHSFHRNTAKKWSLTPIRSLFTVHYCVFYQVYEQPGTIQQEIPANGVWACSQLCHPWSKTCISYHIHIQMCYDGFALSILSILMTKMKQQQTKSTKYQERAIGSYCFWCGLGAVMFNIRLFNPRLSEPNIWRAQFMSCATRHQILLNPPSPGIYWYPCFTL